MSGRVGEDAREELHGPVEFRPALRTVVEEFGEFVQAFVADPVVAVRVAEAVPVLVPATVEEGVVVAQVLLRQYPAAAAVGARTTSADHPFRISLASCPK